MMSIIAVQKCTWQAISIAIYAYSYTIWPAQVVKSVVELGGFCYINFDWSSTSCTWHAGHAPLGPCPLLRPCPLLGVRVRVSISCHGT